MKIALLECTTGLNIGNQFINRGCEYLINQLFPNTKLDKYESLETINTNYMSYLPAFQEQLNSYDLIFIACGSLISKWGILTFRTLSRLKPKKIFMGLGMFYYNEEEINYCKEIEKYPNCYYFVRDRETYYSCTRQYKNIFLGIDCAFYLSDIQSKIQRKYGNKHKYAVVNLDSIPANINRIKEVVKDFKKAYDDVYVIENTVNKYNIPEIKNNYLLLSHWYSLYQLYQNASFVVTNRVHTTVACLSNNVPVCFVWTYKDVPKTKRLNLFKRVGILVRPEYAITKDYREQIEKYKMQFLNLLKIEIIKIIDSELK